MTRALVVAGAVVVAAVAYWRHRVIAELRRIRRALERRNDGRA